MMQVIKPFEVTDENMTSTIPEPDPSVGEVEWDIGRTISLSPGDDVYGVASDETRVYLSTQNTVFIYDRYTFKLVGSFAQPLPLPTPFARSIAHASGLLYLCDIGSLSSSTTVTVVTTDGDFVRSFSCGIGTGNNVLDITIHNGSLYIMGQQDSNVYVCDLLTGSEVAIYNVDPPVSNVAQWIASVSSDLIYIADSNGRIRAFDSECNFETDISGTLDGRITVIDSEVWVSFSANLAQRRVISGNSVIDGNIYVANERAVLASTSKVYEAVSTNDNRPDVGVSLTPPTWVEVSATNKYKAFDYSKNIDALTQSPLIIELTPGKVFSAIAGFNINGATSINITVTDPVDGVVYDNDIDMNDVTGIVNMWNYFFYEPSLIDSFTIDDLPPYRDATITLTFVGDGQISVGEIAYGRSKTIGVATYGSSYDRISYSNIEIDEFGNETVTLRPSASYTSFEVTLDTSKSKFVEKILKDTLDIPTLFIADSIENEKIVDLGYYERSELVLSNYTNSEVTIKVRGLV